MKITQGTVSYCGVCSWPWRWFVLDKADHTLLVNSNRRIPVQNTLGWSAFVFCACEIMQLCSMVLCVVTAVLKFDFKFTVNETPNKWRTVDRMLCSGRELCSCRICIFCNDRRGEWAVRELCSCRIYIFCNDRRGEWAVRELCSCRICIFCNDRRGEWAVPVGCIVVS
jgi:hypothetical protein